MTAITFEARPAIGVRRHLWQRRVVDRAHATGMLVCLVILLLGFFLATGTREAEIAIYAICIVAVLPHVAPFMASTRRYPANALFVIVFVILGLATIWTFDERASTMLQAKALAATAVWASIYAVVFCAIRSDADVRRFARWIHWA